MRRKPEKRIWWTRRETEAYLEVSRTRVRQLAKHRRIRCRKNRQGHFEYHRDDILRYAQERPVRTRRPPRQEWPRPTPRLTRAEKRQIAIGYAADNHLMLLDRRDISYVKYALDGFWTTDMTPRGLALAIDQVRRRERTITETVIIRQHIQHVERLEREIAKLSDECLRHRLNAEKADEEKRRRPKKTVAPEAESPNYFQQMAAYLAQRHPDKMPDDDVLLDEMTGYMRSTNYNWMWPVLTLLVQKFAERASTAGTVRSPEGRSLA